MIMTVIVHQAKLSRIPYLNSIVLAGKFFAHARQKEVEIQMQNTMSLTSGSIGKVLLRFSVPFLLANLLKRFLWRRRPACCGPILRRGKCFCGFHRHSGYSDYYKPYFRHDPRRNDPCGKNMLSMKNTEKDRKNDFYNHHIFCGLFSIPHTSYYKYSDSPAAKNP